MIYGLPRYNVPLPQFGVWKDGFTPEEIENILFLEKLNEFGKGFVDGQKLVPEARDSEVSFLPLDENTQWVFERLGQIIPRANYDLFMFDIAGIQTLQYTIYREGQFYDWHADTVYAWENYQRKISGSILLSDPDEYEGGELDIIATGSPDRVTTLKPEKGHIAFFNSAMPHRVRPVTKGVRKSLVFWVIGPRGA